MTEEGPFLTADLAGCRVVTEAGEVLGIFKDVISSRAHDIWMVEGLREDPIPARKEIILSVDIAAKKILVRLPPGSARFMKAKAARPDIAGERVSPGLRIDVLTLFPKMFEGPLSESLMGKAWDKGLVDFRVRDIRDFSDDEKHRKVDDRPFGGGAGMVMKPEPLFRALRACGVPAAKKKGKGPFVIYMSPQGRPLTQALADGLAKRRHLVLLCGHYEGIDERIFGWIDLEVSVGDVVYTGGEIPALALTDAVVRKVPGTVKEEDSLTWDSFGEGWSGGLDCPHYTRPAVWRKKPVPAVLTSGDHKAVQAWRAERARENTRRKRPDLLAAPPEPGPVRPVANGGHWPPRPTRHPG